MAEVLKPTPFHPRTAPLCESHAWRRWAGCLSAVSYELSHEREYHVIRVAAGLLDISPLYKYRIHGRDAARLLDRVMTRDIGRLAVGQVAYSTWCNGEGKVLDDGTISRLAEDEFRVTSAEPQMRWFSRCALGFEVTIEDCSEWLAALALQGPAARAILSSAADTDLAALGYFRLARTRVRGRDVTVSRTGYTGDLGYELWVDALDALAVWDALIEAGVPHGLAPAGLAALDVARIEAGLMLLDVDYVPANKALTPAQTSSPYELDLGWSVDLRKPAFSGRAALAAESERGAAWKMIGVEVDWDSFERLHLEAGIAPRLPAMVWRASVPLYARGRQIGYCTSGVWSPLLKKYIALAHVEEPWSAPDTALEIEITVEHRRRRAGARVVKRPFFDPERKRQ